MLKLPVELLDYIIHEINYETFVKLPMTCRFLYSLRNRERGDELLVYREKRVEKSEDIIDDSIDERERELNEEMMQEIMKNPREYIIRYWESDGMLHGLYEISAANTVSTAKALKTLRQKEYFLGKKVRDSFFREPYGFPVFERIYLEHVMKNRDGLECTEEEFRNGKLVYGRYNIQAGERVIVVGYVPRWIDFEQDDFIDGLFEVGFKEKRNGKTVLEFKEFRVFIDEKLVFEKEFK